MIHLEPFLAASLVGTVREFVMVTKLHPILVNFTAALVPVSLASDVLGRLGKSEPLRNTAWWTLLYAAFITPFTVLTGWLFWMPDDNGASGMSIHKWLGSGLAVLLVVLFIWRRNLHRRQQWPPMSYLIAGGIFIAALIVQGYLGGKQVFSSM